MQAHTKGARFLFRLHQQQLTREGFIIYPDIKAMFGIPRHDHRGIERVVYDFAPLSSGAATPTGICFLAPWSVRRWRNSYRPWWRVGVQIHQ